MRFPARTGPAARCAGQYLGIYSLAGFVLIPLIAGIAAGSEAKELISYFLITHLGSAVVLWLPGTFAAFVLWRWLGPLPPRRLWIAGILAVPVVWMGTLICQRFSSSLYQGLNSTLGWGWSTMLVCTAWAILFSNGMLALMWILPGRAARE